MKKKKGLKEDEGNVATVEANPCKIHFADGLCFERTEKTVEVIKYNDARCMHGAMMQASIPYDSWELIVAAMETEPEKPEEDETKEEDTKGADPADVPTDGPLSSAQIPLTERDDKYLTPSELEEKEKQVAAKEAAEKEAKEAEVPEWQKTLDKNKN